MGKTWWGEFGAGGGTNVYFGAVLICCNMRVGGGIRGGGEIQGLDS